MIHENKGVEEGDIGVLNYYILEGIFGHVYFVGRYYLPLQKSTAVAKGEYNKVCR